jgi:hypothetical protein
MNAEARSIFRNVKRVSVCRLAEDEKVQLFQFCGLADGVVLCQLLLLQWP